MQELIKDFNFHGQEFRIITNKNNQIFFVAKDVCDILGYNNSTDAINRHCKKDGVAFHDLIDNLGRSQKMTIINESNFYRLVLKSKKKESEVFESWVCDEVLPSIRKTGKYETNPIPTSYAQALLEAGRLALEIESKNLLIEEMQPKVDFYNTVTNSKDAIDLGTASKVLKLGYGRTTLFKNLRDIGILMKNNIPYQEKVDAGWFQVVETSWSKPNGDSHLYCKTLVLQKGLDGIRRLLAN